MSDFKEENKALMHYPFGMLMPGRNFSSETYRFGFNSQEKDNEIAGEGNSNTAEYWQYDTRLGRRWNVDPILYSWQSSYSVFNNNPLIYSDPLGLFGTKREARKYKRQNKLNGRIEKSGDGF